MRVSRKVSTRAANVCTVVLIAVAGWKSTEPAATAADSAAGLAAFETVRAVLQHPRCQNCHIPGEAPLQLDEGVTHAMNVKRGPDGHGAAGLQCLLCHADKNPPVSYGPHMPPGAPGWHLPPPDKKMVFIGLSAAELCQVIKDPKQTGGRDLQAMFEHMRDDKLVAWGWSPGAGREPVPIPQEEVVAKFKVWMDAGAPCPQ